MALMARELAALPLPPLPASDPRVSIPTLQDVFAARRVVVRYLSPTPLLRSEALSERLGFEVRLKCENLQPGGAFKVRGGLNLLSRLSSDALARGVVTASTGNHGLSIAYAAREFGARAIIYVPEGANPDKVAAIERFGGSIVFAGCDFDECRAAAGDRADRDGMHFVHSANERDLIAGVGTYTLEILEEMPDLEYLFVPVGGGSGLCGACVAGKGINPNLKIIGVQAAGAPAVRESWKRRRLVSFDRAETFAEGLATRTAFELPAHILWDCVDDIVVASDREMKRAILTLLETTGMLAEGAGAAALAAAHSMRAELSGKRVACVISGGNLTLNGLRQAMDEEQAW